MIEFDKWALPNGERHLQGWMKSVNNRKNGRLSYQYGKYEKALEFCKDRRIAIDIGAHVGLWSFHMAHDFEQVVAFEPCEEHQECWYKNMEGLKNAELFDFALGNTEGFMNIKHLNAGSSGDTITEYDSKGKIKSMTLDTFLWNDVDFVKIDCEGFEQFIVEGGSKLFHTQKPCVIVEQKPGKAQQFGLEETGAVQLLQKWGAVLRASIAGDYIMSWD